MEKLLKNIKKKSIIADSWIIKYFNLFSLLLINEIIFSLITVNINQKKKKFDNDKIKKIIYIIIVYIV